MKKIKIVISFIFIFVFICNINADTTNSVEFSEEELSSEFFKKYDKFCNETGIQI